MRDRRLVIWHLPTHKKPCLMVVEGNCATKIASFNNDEAAKLFCEVVNEIVIRDTAKINAILAKAEGN